MKIGWIGLGPMGLPMSSNLVAAGHEVTGYDLDKDAVARFAAAGGRAAASIAEACQGAEVVFSSIPGDLQLRRVALAAGGVIPSSAKGTIYVDMSTVSPDVSREVAIGSPLLQYKKDPLKARDFSPASFVTTSAKDQRLFVEAAQDAGVPVDIADTVADVFRQMVDAGDGRLDFFATVLRTEKAAGLGEV